MCLNSVKDKEDKNKNYAFEDGQNLYMGTAKREAGPWRIDLARFRVYLEQKYHVCNAYYHLGNVGEKNQDLLKNLIVDKLFKFYRTPFVYRVFGVIDNR